MANTVRSAKAVVLDAAGRALLLRRSNTHPEFALQADLPGGILQPSETYEQGMLRELQEETGLVAEQIGGSHRIYMGTFYTPGDGLVMERLLLGIRLHDKEPAIMLSAEHSEYAWVSPDELRGIEEPYQGGIRYMDLYKIWDTM